MRPTSPVLGRRFPVVSVEVPRTAGRLITFHEIPEPTPLHAIEVLHHQSTATVGPIGEVGVMTQELVRSNRFNAQLVEAGKHAV